MDIAFHHKSLTAKPLFEIMRALYAETVNALGTAIPEERATIDGVLSQIAKDYQDLGSKRNSLLHGTWFIGGAHPDDQDFSPMCVAKFKATKDGLAPAQLPESASGLREITEQCSHVAHMIRALQGCFF